LVRAGLPDVVAEGFARGPEDDVRRGVVSHEGLAAFSVDDARDAFLQDGGRVPSDEMEDRGPHPLDVVDFPVRDRPVVGLLGSSAILATVARPFSSVSLYRVSSTLSSLRMSPLLKKNSG